jgi:hypothetical protein
MSRANLSLYELLKRSFEHLNPHATPAEYQRAMREIAKQCGI